MPTAPDPRLATIYRIAEQHRKNLDKSEHRASLEMADAWNNVLRSLAPRIDAITDRIRDARANGETVNPAWLYQQERYRNLINASLDQVSDFAYRANSTISTAQGRAADDAVDAAYRMAQASLGMPRERDAPTVLVRPAPERVKDIVGFLSDGSPLASLLAELGPQAARDIGRALIVGIATGLNPRETAREMRLASNLTRLRAETIARTEMHRAAREATRRLYEDNSDVVEGWIWLCAKQLRTCASCWAMNGTFHKVTEHLNDHVRGRCVMIPQTKTWEELGFSGIEETRVVEPLGSEIFSTLPADHQRAILGPTKHDLYTSKQINLEDMAHLRRSRQWGDSYEAASVKQALAAAKTRQDAEKRALTARTGPKEPGAPRNTRKAKPEPQIESGAQTRAKLLDEDITQIRAGIRSKIFEVINQMEKSWEDELKPLLDVPNDAPEYQRVNREIDAIGKRGEKMQKQLLRLQKQERSYDADKISDTLLEKYIYQNPSKTSVSIKPRPGRDTDGKRLRAQWERGISAWRRMIGPATDMETKAIQVRFVGTEYTERGLPIPQSVTDLIDRAYMRGDGTGPFDGVFMRRVAREDSYGRLYSEHAAMVHELTHWLEHVDGYVARQVQTYYDKRTAGEALEPMDSSGNRYASHEQTRPDKFLDRYMGKDYGRVGSHELMTMAIQRMYADPVAFATQDPDMFDWLLDVLRRRLP